MADSKYNEVHVQDSNDLESIDVEYAYLTIPKDYVCLYHRLLVYMADFGKELASDCTTMCKNGSRNIITCWNMFQSAIACHALGRDKEASFFISYIESQLELIYKGTDKTMHSGSVPIAITEDGHLKGLLSCGDSAQFEVDVETGELYRKYLSDRDTKVYTVQDDDLIVEDTSDND